MNWIVLLAAVPSFVIALITVPLIRHVAIRVGFVDRPGVRKVHREPVPLGGGLAIFVAVLLPLLLGTVVLMTLGHGAGEQTVQALFGRGPLATFIVPHLAGMKAQLGNLWILLGAATAMMVLGWIDDARGLDWRLRLAIQTLLAIVLVSQGWRLSVFLDATAITLPLSVLWIVGVVNSFNMLDNMDGLSAGVAWIAVTILAVVMLLAPDPETSQPQLFVAGLLCVVSGALLGFLPYNWSPASIFMGDAGSYFVGFVIASTTLLATFAGGALPRHAILAPLCVLAVPFYDTLSVVVIRIREGRSPFHGDQRHFSHRLVGLGASTRQAVATIYLTTATCGLGALLLHQVDLWGAGTILLMVAAVLSVIAILESMARRS